MSDISPNLKMLIMSIMVSQNAYIGSVRGADDIIKTILNTIAKTDIDAEETDNQENTALLKNVPNILMDLAKEDLAASIPGEAQLKDWVLYKEDFSGIAFYTTADNKLTFAYIARGVDLSSGDQHYNNRYEAKSYSDAHFSGDQEAIKIAEDTLKANLPGKKIKYCHWTGNKPSKQESDNFQSNNPEFFQLTLS